MLLESASCVIDVERVNGGDREHEIGYDAIHCSFRMEGTYVSGLDRSLETIYSMCR